VFGVRGCEAARRYRLSVSILDDGAAVTAAVSAEDVAAVPGGGACEIVKDFGLVNEPAVVLADEEGEVGVAALAPEDGFVLHPARTTIVLDCSGEVNAEAQTTCCIEPTAKFKTKAQTKANPVQEPQYASHKPGMTHRWQGRVQTRKILGIGMRARAQCLQTQVVL
jgi:hypothetical protein